MVAILCKLSLQVSHEKAEVCNGERCPAKDHLHAPLGHLGLDVQRLEGNSAICMVWGWEG